jgi:hypothetical protein
LSSPVIPKPASYPDLTVYPGDPPVSWKVAVRENGVAVDLTNSTMSAPVTDDGKQVGELQVDPVDLLGGVVQLTLTPEVYAAIGRYSTWRFREDTIFRFPLLQGRIVKEL